MSRYGCRGPRCREAEPAETAATPPPDRPQSPPVTACACDPPRGEKIFFCAPHRRRKTPHDLLLCRTRPKYFNYWRELATRQPLVGLGDRLAWLLWRVGLARLAHAWYAWRRRSCRCEARRRTLNRLWPW